jgi:hypothetical protein
VFGGHFMEVPSLEFLCGCLATALLSHYGITQLPVPMRDILAAPPPDLSHDLSLTEVSFGESIWLRPPSGQGSVFVNVEMSPAERRYAMARSLFIGLCSTKGGREAGLPAVPNDNLKAQSDLFARRLLMAPELLPNDWRHMAPDALAELCGVPRAVAAAHLQAAQQRRGERG